MRSANRMDASVLHDETIMGMICGKLVRGGVVVYGTDTLCALGGSALCEAGVKRVAALKGRPQGMPMSYAFADVDSALDWTVASPLAETIMRKNLPGPLTVVLPASAKAPKYVVNLDGTLGVRVPDNEYARALFAECGPMTTTSANLHGGKDPHNADEVSEELASQVDYVLDFGPCKHAKGSTIIKITGEDITLLREGVLTLQALKR